MGGLVFGMVRVLVNWWAYTWEGLYSGGGLIFGGLWYFKLICHIFLGDHS